MSSENQEKKQPDFKGFIIGILYHIIITILLGFMLFGSIGLFTCKVAQSNILPDNVKLAPFTNTMRNVEEIDINMNIIKEYGLKGLGWLLFQDPISVYSQKTQFSNEDAIKGYYKGILGKINSYKDLGNYWLYFTNVLNSMIATNNYLTTYFYQGLNSFCSEWMIIIIYTLLFPFIYLFMFFYNFWLTIWFHITHIGDLFKKQTDKEWEKDDDVSYFRPFKIFWMIVLAFFIGIPIFIIWIFSTIYSIFSPLFSEYKIKGEQGTKNFMSFFVNTIKYKKQLLMILLSFFLLQQTNTSLGSNYTASALIAIIVAAFMGFYKEVVPDSSVFTTGLTSYTKAKSNKGKEISEYQVEQLTEQQGGKKIKGKKYK